MKRLSVIFIAILILAAGGSLAAFDVGGSLTSGTDLSTLDVVGAATEAKVGLWLESGKGEHYSFEMKLDLTAAFTDDGFDFFFNPDYLKLDSLWDDLDYGPSIYATSFGRFTTSDFTGRVFSQKLDGMIMNFNYPAVELTVAAGTTALMFTESGSILNSASSTIMSKTDALQANDGISLMDLIFDPAATGTVFDSPRAVEILTLTFPEAVAKQSFTLSLVAQEDLRPMLEKVNGYFDNSVTYPVLQEGESVFYGDRGGAVDTQYVGAGVSGPSIGSLYHNVYYYFGTGRALSYTADGNSPTGYSYQYDMILSHMAGFSLDYYMDWLFNSRISAGANFGTGDSDALTLYEGNGSGYYTQFTPITSGGGGMIFSPGLSNILNASVGYSLKPFGWIPLAFLNNMQISAVGMPFFLLTQGPSAVSGISPEFRAEGGNYLGTEIDLSVNWRPFSDLGAIVQIGYFMPNTAAFEAGSDMANPTFMARLNVSLSF